ncbi:SIR2 family protein [Paenibacillus mesotrionivorans]|uniref:SIR2 family protein n=1 Tax=Paenibacillus mesotrionivorans TaxID=3160968 RepID=A0ACC7NZG6_9BACL
MATDWASNMYRVGSECKGFEGSLSEEDIKEARSQIEPWLSALFQSEHLALLLGSGFTSSIGYLTKSSATGMGRVQSFGCKYEAELNAYAESSAKACGRGTANIEDQIRTALALIEGLKIIQDTELPNWEEALKRIFTDFISSLLETEQGINEKITEGSTDGQLAQSILISFLMSFASRTATRERLNIFTTNYDRLIEYACDLIGLRVVDRFVGTLTPIFRSSRIDIDMHYNPPGIRGEPRYLEGVVKLTKLHGSLDWHYADKVLQKWPVPFGAPPKYFYDVDDPIKKVMIYPNPAKDVETLQYPYAELFRDFSAALCRPNSAIITYGYGFGDDHINRVIADMLTIPSTHLVIISFDTAGGRIPKFVEKVGRDAQISLLIGNHFGDISNLVKHYLPKSAIDTITMRKSELLAKRAVSQQATSHTDNKADERESTL